jgi:hypothetical protein
LLTAATASVEDVDVKKGVGSLIAAEKAYATVAGQKGFREAFLSMFR